MALVNDAIRPEFDSVCQQLCGMDGCKNTYCSANQNYRYADRLKKRKSGRRNSHKKSFIDYLKHNDYK